MQLTRPTLLLDKKKAIGNIARMAAKAKLSGARLRPHFKTHQSAQVGEWFREFGVESITVSSVHMAEYFAAHGWTDILVAFPANVLEMERINRLAASINLHLITVNPETTQALAKGLKHPVKLWLKIDSGTHRTGILPHDYTTIEANLESINQSAKLNFAGFLVHDGHTYKQRDKASVQTIHHTTLNLLHLLRDKYKPQFPDLQLSIGDTPSCSMLDTLAGVDELRPGNFVFYDLMQLQIGSCTTDEIAVCVACPVVAKHPERNEIILYGGSVHFSKEALTQADGSLYFGRIVEQMDAGWGGIVEGLEVMALSQEHGVVRATDEAFSKYSIGDLMYVLPVHSCLTADLMRSYLTLEGERLEHLSGLGPLL